MSNAFYRLAVGGSPMPSDINQLVDALSGVADVGAMKLAPVLADPTTAIGTATATAGTGLGVGTYLYAYTYVTGIRKDNGTLVVNGETLPASTKSVTTTSSNQIVSLSSIPTSGASSVIGIRIYRTVVGGAQLKLVATIPATQTTYVDSLPDASLGANAPTSNTTGSYIDLTGSRIANVPTPTASGDVANKSYTDSTRIGRGTSNQTVETYQALLQTIDTRTTTYSYTSGRITGITITDGATTVKSVTINYNGDGTVGSLVETVAGKTITTTVNYTSGAVSSVTRTVV